MTEYLLKNKEWIFSGIGVSTIALIFIAFKYFFHRANPVTKKELPNYTDTFQGSKSTDKVDMVGDIPQEKVYEIIRELEEIPPLHLDDIRKNYIGLKVNWLTEYYSAYKKDNDIISVHLIVISESMRPIIVSIEVLLSEYKQFSIMKRNAKIRVIGCIEKFEGYSFGLSNVQLFFE